MNIMNKVKPLLLKRFFWVGRNLNFRLKNISVWKDLDLDSNRNDNEYG